MARARAALLAWAWVVGQLLLPLGAADTACHSASEVRPSDDALQELAAEASPKLTLLQVEMREGSGGKAGALAMSHLDAAEILRASGSTHEQAVASQTTLPLTDIRVAGTTTTTSIHTINIPQYLLEYGLREHLNTALAYIDETCRPRHRTCEAGMDLIRFLLSDMDDNTDLSREQILRRMIKLVGVGSWLYRSRNAHEAWDRMDLNGDGELSFEEFWNDSEERFSVGDPLTNITVGVARRFFNLLDRDQDGAVTKVDVWTYLRGILRFRDFVPEIDPMTFLFGENYSWVEIIDEILKRPLYTTTQRPVPIPEWASSKPLLSVMYNATALIRANCVPVEELCEAGIEFSRLLASDIRDHWQLTADLQLRRIIKLSAIHFWLYEDAGPNGAFMRMDKNGDDLLTREEFLEGSSVRFQVGSTHTNITQGLVQRLWAVMDRDGDEQCSRVDIRNFLWGVMLVKEFVPELDPVYFYYGQHVSWNKMISIVDNIMLRPRRPEWVTNW